MKQRSNKDPGLKFSEKSLKKVTGRETDRMKNWDGENLRWRVEGRLQTGKAANREV